MASNSKNLAELLNSDVTLTATDIANGAVTTDKLADSAVTAAKWGGGQLGRRNIIINGAMQVAQRGTSASVTTGQSPLTVDRFRHCGGFSGFTATESQDLSSTPSGFRNAYKLEVTSTLGTTSSGLYNSLLYLVEGYDHSRLRWGWADAQSATFSFYVKSSVTGQYGINFTNGTLNYLTSYTINTANTWERKIITIPAETSGAWNGTNGVALYIRWDLGVGSVYEASTTEDWSLTGNIWGLTGGVKLYETNGAVFSVTGVQLEVGDTATPFEHISYPEEYRSCQRYYIQDGGGAYASLLGGQGFNITTTLCSMKTYLPAVMRAQPTFSYTGTPRVQNGQSGYALSNLTGGFPSNTEGKLNMYNMTGTSSGMTLYQPMNIDANVGGGFVKLDAEL